MANLVFDLDADSLGATGSAVSSWTDSVGSRALAQATAALQPAVVAGPNGHKAVKFDGDSLVNMTTGAVAQPALTIVMVMRLDAIASVARSGVINGTGSASANDYDTPSGNWGLSNPASTGNTAFQSLVLSGAPSNGVDSNIKTLSDPLNTFVVITAALGTDGVAVRVYTNGTQDTVSTPAIDGADMSMQRLTLGMRGYASGTPDYGRFSLARLRIHSGRMTASERATEHTAMSDRYGITVSDYITPADTTAPTVPANLAAASNSPTQVSLSWSASTDAVGVASYRLRRNGSDLSGATALTATNFSDTSAVAGTAYSYTVSAVDAAGNRSAESAAVSITTPTPAPSGRVLDRWSGSALIRRKLDRWSGTALINRIVEIATAGVSIGFPEALGSLTARPSWVNTAAADGPLDQPAVSTRTRTLQLPNLPAAGQDLTSAWVAYFGNQVGSNGTWAAGDRVTIPAGEWIHAGNLDIPPAVNDVEIVLGTASGACTLTSTSNASGNNTPPQIGLRVLSANNVRIRAASQAYPAVLRSLGIAGRGDKNQQGHALLEVEYCTGFRAQDLLIQDSKAAGVFMYRADNYWFNRVRVERSKADAWHATNGSSYGLYTDCSSDGAGDDMMAFVHYDRRDAAVSVSHHMEVYRYIGKRNGHGRGFAIIACHDIYADRVIIEGSAAAGLIIDREASSSGSNPEQGIYGVLLQRFQLLGCNWSEQDHGSVFIGNGNTGNTVAGRLESFHIRDNRLYQTAVRGVGSGTMTMTLKDFKQYGGLTDSANNNRTKVGGNWASPSTMEQINWTLDTTGPADSTDPTVVINTPGQYATVSGTLTGASGSSTHLMTNAQAIQYYVGDSPSGIASMSVTVDGSTGNGLGTPTARDSAGRGSVVWNTTAVANGPHTITVMATDGAGRTTTRSVTVTVAN